MKVSDFGLPLDRRTDIGGGVEIKPILRFDDIDDMYGFVIFHKHPDGEECMGTVPISPLAPTRWEVRSVQPLTLYPSISQKSGPDHKECLHGFITDGRWVSCGQA